MPREAKKLKRLGVQECFKVSNEGIDSAERSWWYRTAEKSGMRIKMKCLPNKEVWLWRIQ